MLNELRDILIRQNLIQGFEIIGRLLHGFRAGLGCGLKRFERRDCSLGNLLLGVVY